MGDRTKIEWTQATWNPWQGCHKVSAGCDNCYMYRDKGRYGQDPKVIVRSKPQTFYMPKSLMRLPPGTKVFVCSWSDFFHKAADPWRTEAWELIRNRPDLIFQIVTKRPERIMECLPLAWGPGWKHVWLGVSVEDQKTADERIPILLQTPAAVRWISAEPLLKELTLVLYLPVIERGRGGPIQSGGGLDWVVVGGESGPKARPMNIEWVRDILNQCAAAGVACFVKQLGAHPVYTEQKVKPLIGAIRPLKLKDLKGGDWSEWPEDLRVKEFPR